MCKKQSLYGLRSQYFIQMLVPKVRTELGKKKLLNMLPLLLGIQKELKLWDVITMGEFKSILKDREQESIGRCDLVYPIIEVVLILASF